MLLVELHFSFVYLLSGTKGPLKKKKLNTITLHLTCLISRVLFMIYDVLKVLKFKFCKLETKFLIPIPSARGKYFVFIPK